jgi:hypothetical protein
LIAIAGKASLLRTERILASRTLGASACKKGSLDQSAQSDPCNAASSLSVDQADKDRKIDLGHRGSGDIDPHAARLLALQEERVKRAFPLDLSSA